MHLRLNTIKAVRANSSPEVADSECNQAAIANLELFDEDGNATADLKRRKASSTSKVLGVFLVRLLVLTSLLAGLGVTYAHAQTMALEKLQGLCTRGGQVVQVAGAASSQKAEQVVPSCTVAIYVAGTLTPATIYSDRATSPTPKGNPFTANAAGEWNFYAAQGRYDIRLSGGTGAGAYTSPVTYGDYWIVSTTASGGGTVTQAYTTVRNNSGTNLTQRNTLGLSENITPTDNPTLGSTDLRLTRVPTGVFNLTSDFGAVCSATEFAGNITTGTPTLTIPLGFAAYEWKVGAGIKVFGAGASSTDLLTTVSSISGNTITLSANAQTTVASARVSHDDTAALQAAINNKYNISIPSGYCVISSPITIPATTEGSSIVIEGQGAFGQSTLLYQGLGSLFVAPSGTIEGFTVRNLAIATSTPGSPYQVRPTVNRGHAFDFSSTGVVNFPRFENNRIIGWGRSGIFCANCQGGIFTRNIFRSNAGNGLALVSTETTLVTGSEPNVNLIENNLFDLAPYISDNDVALTGLSMAAGSTTVNAATSLFTTAYEGRNITILNAGAGGGDIIGIIKTVVSATQITVSMTNQTGGNLNNLSGTISRTNHSPIYLHRANNTTLTSNTIQGNWSGSPAELYSVYARNLNALSATGTWIESTGGAAGYDWLLWNTRAATIDTYHSNADPVTANENAGGNIKCVSCYNTTIRGIHAPNPTIHFNLDSASKSFVVQSGELSAPENVFNQYDQSRDKLVIGDGVTYFSEGGSSVSFTGTASLYDDHYGSNSLLNPRFDDTYTSWTNSQPTYTSVIGSTSTPRFTKYLLVNTQGLTDGSPGVALTQTFTIPDTIPSGPWVFGYDHYIESFGATGATSREVQVDITTSGGTGSVGNAYFKFQSTNPSNLSTGVWNRFEGRVFVGTGTGRTLTLRILASTGPNTPRIRLANFRLQPGKHLSYSNDEVLTELRGGRIRTPGTLRLDTYFDIAAMAAPAVSAAATGRMYFDSSSNTLKCSENGGAYVNCVGSGGGGSPITINQAKDKTDTTTGTVSGQILYPAIAKHSAAQLTVTQAAHGFSALTPVYQAASGVWFAAVNTDTSKWATDLILEVVDADNFILAGSQGNFVSTAHGKSVGTWYWLADAGGLTATFGTGPRQPILTAVDANTLKYLGGYPAPVASGGGTGTITSVNFSAPSSVFTVTGVPITSGAGTITIDFVNQATNLVLASPNGSSGSLTPRQLVVADLVSSARTGNATKFATVTSNTPGTCPQWDANGNLISITCGGGGSSGVSSFNGRTGAVIATALDYTFSQLGGTLASTQDYNTGVSAGTYNCANVTVNATGRVTSIGVGTCSGGGGSTLWSGLGTPTANLNLALADFDSVFTRSTALTNTVRNVFTFVHNTSAASAPGLGAGLLFQSKTSTGNIIDVGSLSFNWQNHNNATPVGKFDVRLNYAGSAGTSIVVPLDLIPGKLGLQPYDTTAGSTTGLAFHELAANGTDYILFKSKDSNIATVNYILDMDSPPSSGTYGLKWTAGNIITWGQFENPLTALTPLVRTGDQFTCPTCVTANPFINQGSVTFSGLGTPSNNTFVPCSDCGKDGSGTCTSGGTGAFAFRINNVWKCFTN